MMPVIELDPDNWVEPTEIAAMVHHTRDTLIILRSGREVWIKDQTPADIARTIRPHGCWVDETTRKES